MTQILNAQGHQPGWSAVRAWPDRERGPRSTVRAAAPLPWVGGAMISRSQPRISATASAQQAAASDSAEPSTPATTSGPCDVSTPLVFLAADSSSEATAAGVWSDCPSCALLAE